MEQLFYLILVYFSLKIQPKVIYELYFEIFYGLNETTENQFKNRKQKVK